MICWNENVSHFKVSKTSDVLQSATNRSQPEQNEVINTGNRVTTTHERTGHTAHFRIS